MIIQGRKHRVIQGFKYGKRTPDKAWCEPYQRPSACKHLIEQKRLEFFMKKFHLDTIVLFEDIPAENWRIII